MGRKFVIVAFAGLALLVAVTYVAWRLHRPWSLRDSVLDYEWANPDVAPSGQVHYKVHIAPDHTGTVTYWKETGSEPPQVWAFRLADGDYDRLTERLTADGLLRTPRQDGGVCAGCDWNRLRVAEGTRSVTAEGPTEDIFEALQQAIPEDIWDRMPQADR